MPRYAGFQEWVDAGVQFQLLGKDEQHVLLKQLGLPTPDFIKMPLHKLRESTLAKRFVESNNGVVAISLPQKMGLKKHALVGPASFESIVEFARSIQPSEHYDFLITQMVHGLQDGFIGTALSNGKGSVLIELLLKPFWTDIRELTSGETDPAILRTYWKDNGKERIVPKDLNAQELRNIARWVAPHHGHFEFIKGTKNGETGAWFMEAQPYSSLCNIFEPQNREVLEARTPR